MNFANTVWMHYVKPAVTVVACVAAGPRGLLKYSHFGPILIIPLIWLAARLTVGEVLRSYPYSFLDVASFAYATVAINVVGILVGATVLGAVIVTIDRTLSRCSAG